MPVAYPNTAPLALRAGTPAVPETDWAPISLAYVFISLVPRSRYPFSLPFSFTEKDRNLNCGC